MIPLIQKEVTDKRHWISNSEMLDIVAISESTPGPISINSATYIGYRKRGFLGSVFATLGLIIPSFLVILVVSYVYKKIIDNAIIVKAFDGIKIAVVVLLFNAFIKFYSQLEKGKFYIHLIIIFAVIISALFDIFNIVIQIGSFGLSISLIMIIICILIGIIDNARSRRISK